jgi:3-keto-disaccharide hydrolase
MRYRLLGMAYMTAILGLIGGEALTAAAQKTAAPEVPPRKGKSETINLFNGKDLEGWEGYTDLWSVRDGAIVAKNSTPLKFSTYLFSKKSFTDFRLVFSAKLAESEMHSGVAIWGKKFVPKEATDAAKEKAEFTYQGHLVMFPSGWGLFDLYRRMGAINPSQALRDPAIKAGKQHDWNDMEILAQGNRIRLAVNGKQVLDWRDPQPEMIAEGPIALQLHSNNVPQEIHFKGLVLTTFPEEDKLITVK